MDKNRDYLVIAAVVPVKKEKRKDRIFNKTATEKYMEGWETIFGTKREVAKA